MMAEINFNVFVNKFFECGRGEQFSKKALRLIYDYLEEIAQDHPVPYVLDVIEICSAWSEISKDEVVKETGYSLKELAEQTQVLVDNNVVVYSVL